DQCPLPQRLGLERPRSLRLRQSFPFLARLACRIHVAGELDIAAEWQRRDFPARAPPVGIAEQLLAEAARERFGFHAEPAPDQVMPKLVDRDERPQQQQEADQVHPEWW